LPAVTTNTVPPLRFNSTFGEFQGEFYATFNIGRAQVGAIT